MICVRAAMRSLDELIEEGSLTEEQLDRAVLRVLRLKNKLGLFENPSEARRGEREQEVFRKTEFRPLAKEAAGKFRTAGK